MATSIDNLINVAFRKGEDLSRFGLKVGGKGDYRPPQFDAESLKFEYIDANESYGIDLNGSRFLQKLSFAESQDFTRATTGTFIGSNGLIQTAAIDAPRFTHDPVTREVQGLLIEEQRTNHWTQNTDLTGADEVGSVTLASSLEFGDFSFRLEATTAGQGIRIHEYGVPYSEGTRKGVYVKAGELSVINLSVHGGSSTTIRFYLLTQQVDSLNSRVRVINPMIEDFGGGWFRISIEIGSSPNGAYTSFRIYGLDDDGGTANIQSGDGFYLALPQIEEATFSTLSSPIITNGTQVTRAADDCVRVLGDEFNPNQWSIYLDATAAEDSGNFQYIFNLQGSGSGDPEGVQITNAYVRVRADNSTTYLQLTGNNEGSHKYAIAFDGARYIIVRDGVSTGWAAGDPIDSTTAGFPLRLSDNSVYTAGCIYRDFRITPTALSEAELITLTGGT